MCEKCRQIKAAMQANGESGIGVSVNMQKVADLVHEIGNEMKEGEPSLGSLAYLMAANLLALATMRHNFKCIAGAAAEAGMYPSGMVQVLASALELAAYVEVEALKATLDMGKRNGMANDLADAGIRERIDLLTERMQTGFNGSGPILVSIADVMPDGSTQTEDLTGLSAHLPEALRGKVREILGKAGISMEDLATSSAPATEDSEDVRRRLQAAFSRLSAESLTKH
jgi:hypothetical protein